MKRWERQTKYRDREANPHKTTQDTQDRTHRTHRTAQDRQDTQDSGRASSRERE